MKMEIKSFGEVIPLQKSVDVGKLGVMAALAVCSGIILISLGRPLVECKLGGDRKDKEEQAGEASGVKSIPSESGEEPGEPKQEAGPAEKDVYELMSESGANELEEFACSPPPSKKRANSKVRLKTGCRKENVSKGRKLSEGNGTEFVNLSTKWNTDTSKRRRDEVKNVRANWTTTETSSCLLFVGSFRTKGNREAHAVCLDSKVEVCPYCSLPLTGALGSRNTTNNENNNNNSNSNKNNTTEDLTRKTSVNKQTSAHSQLQSRVRSLGMRTLTKAIGPDPKEPRQRFVL